MSYTETGGPSKIVLMQENAALRNDIECAIDRETEHVNRIAELEKALAPFVTAAWSVILRAEGTFDGWPNQTQVAIRVTVEGIRRALLVSAQGQGDRTASVSDQRELETK